jgi:putative acetyltransferase
MSIVVRPWRPDEARRFLEIHHEAVRHLAVEDYPASVIDAWAPLPVTDDAVAWLVANRDNELRVMAEMDGTPVGIGALVVRGTELRACYVLPDAARRGVGTALVAAIEDMARERGLTQLRLQSSLTAEPFYTALGYVAERRRKLRLRPGIAMAAITMHKPLADPCSD